MPVNFTEILTGEDVDAAALNSRLSGLDDAIEALVDGSKTLSAPTISDFTNAEHDHEDAAGGGQLGLAALDVSGESDGDVLQVLGGAVVASPIGQIPTGAVMPYAGSSAPTGYIFCDGQAVSRTTYAALFTLIGETYGVGDGATTFNVPDLRGRVVAARDNLGGSSANRVTDGQADVLGGVFGAETHILTTAELASHAHGLNTFVGGSGGNVSGTVSVTPQDTKNTTGAGSGNAHNNVQPSIFLSYIIKA